MPIEASTDDTLRPDRFDLAPLARDVLGRRQEADDVAQDVWLLLRRQPPERMYGLAGWLKLAIVHMARRSRKRDLRRAERERIVARPDRVPSVLEQLELNSLREELIARVDELREPYREVVRLRYLDDREIEEIAARVERSPGTVRSQLTRGLDQLRVRMGVEPSRRRRLSALLPWLRRPAGEWWERRIGKWIGTGPALASGIAAGVLVVLVLLARTQPERGELLASAPRVEDRRGISLDASPPAWRVETAVPISEEPGTPSRPEDGAWAMDVEGDVLEPDGSPVPDAAVLVGKEDGSETRIAARSDAHGHYRIGDVDGRLLIWAEVQEQVSSDRHLIASRDPERRLDLRLGDPVGSLVGRVLSSDGKPVPRAEVALLASRNEPAGFDCSDQGTLVLGPQPIRAITASDGSFRLGRLPHEFWLMVHAEGHPPGMLFRRAHGARQEIEITLPAPCLLEGRLLRPDGAAAAQARLGLVFPEPLPALEATTDEVGRFRFEALPPLPYVLRLVEDPTGASASCFAEGTLEAGMQYSREVTLAEEHTIRGRALDGDRPLEDRIVELVEKDPAPFFPDRRRIRTAPDGSFAFPSCSLGSNYVLMLLGPRATSGPYATAVQVRAGEGGVVLRASESTAFPGSLTGRFESDVPGLLPVIATLRRDSRSQPILLRIDPGTGEYSAAGLPPESYNLRAWVPRVGLWKAGRVEILPGQRTEIVERLPEPGSLQVHLELPESASWERLEVSLTTPPFLESWSKSGVRRLQGASGQNLFTADVFPGEHTLQVVLDGALYESRRLVHVEAGQTTHETLSFLGAIPMWLRITLDRSLHEGERVSLSVEETDRQWNVDVKAATLRNDRSMELRVPLTRDTQELRVSTSLGLRGTLTVTESDIVRDGVLSIMVQEPGDR